ncbi:MAG TPA: NAD-dependent epimerase/dehydratase family protein [Vicinamibacteria bacterium]|nr:NAD-dependent epimerase/dehydratase family protein [Vicinamibacteria bacterium]
MRVLVIGGTGFIGLPLVHRLAQAGHQVAVFHRGRSAALLPAGVRLLHGDRNTLPAHAAELRALRPEVVVDLVLGSERQARALMEVFRGAAARVVALSSQDVYRACGVLHGLEPGPLEPVPLTEDSPLRTRLHTYPPPVIAALKHVFAWLDEEYDKIPVERAVMAEPALPGTVLRLPMVYGPGDPLHRLFPVVKRVDDRRPALLVDERMAGWRATRGYVENVAAAVALAVERDAARGRVYNVGEVAAWAEMEWTVRVARAAGFAGDVRAVPSALTPPHLAPPGNTDQHWTASTARIRGELGFVEPVGDAEALARTIEWERAHPPARVEPGRLDYEAEDRVLAALWTAGGGRTA